VESVKIRNKPSLFSFQNNSLRLGLTQKKSSPCRAAWMMMLLLLNPIHCTFHTHLDCPVSMKWWLALVQFDPPFLLESIQNFSLPLAVLLK
jgi:hypothetical protein